MTGLTWLVRGSLSATLLVACRLNYEVLALSDEDPLSGASGAAGTTSGVGAGGNEASGGGSAGTGNSAGTGTVAGGEPSVEAGAPSGAGAGGAAACSETNAGVEACDGLDNDCNGSIDETNPCEAGCFAAAQAQTGFMFCSLVLMLADAEAYCAQRGMTLLRIDDAAENEWVRSTAFADPVVAVSPFFVLGGSDVALEGDWLWWDGTPFWSGDSNGSPIGNAYANWGDGEPNDMGGAGEHCLAMAPDGTWADIRCSGSNSEMPFGCERN